MDGDAVTNNYQWYKDGTSLNVVNMPFNTEETSTDADAILDYSGSANHGQLGGGNGDEAPTWSSSGKVGGAYDYDGTNDHINIPTHASLNPDYITVSVWFNPEDPTADITQKPIFNKGFTSHSEPYYQYTAFIINTGGLPKRLSFTIAADGTRTTAALNNAGWNYGSWNFYTGTFDGETVRLYLNGVELANNTNPSGATLTGYETDLELAAYTNLAKTTRNVMAGLIDDFRIYDSALSAAQVQKLYDDTKNGYSNSSTITSDETSETDSWICEITPNDATADGTATNSSALTILTAGGDTTKPTWSAVANNGTVLTTKYDVVKWNATIADETALHFYWLATNDTGSYVNETALSTSGLSANVNDTINISAAGGSYICGKIYFNDTSGNENVTDESCITMGQYIAISLSSNLSSIDFGSLSVSTNDNNDTGNYNSTSYTQNWITLSADSSVNVDFCIKANAALTKTGTAQTIPLVGYTYANHTTNAAGTPALGSSVALTTGYVVDTKNLAAGNKNYYRFWLDVPTATEAGDYNNTIYFKAVETGTSC